MLKKNQTQVLITMNNVEDLNNNSVNHLPIQSFHASKPNQIKLNLVSQLPNDVLTQWVILQPLEQLKNHTNL